jgi:hypothetical protein
MMALGLNLKQKVHFVADWSIGQLNGNQDRGASMTTDKNLGCFLPSVHPKWVAPHLFFLSHN